MLERIVSDLSLQVAGSGSSLTLVPHDPVHGQWDEFRIEQVIVNLLTNALRYGCGMPVEVSVHLEGDEVRVDVSDQGKGIAETELHRIFEPFERGIGNRDVKGLGLGLYISRQLAESHGGRLSVIPGPVCGSVFSLTLPISTSD